MQRGTRLPGWLVTVATLGVGTHQAAGSAAPVLPFIFHFTSMLFLFYFYFICIYTLCKR